nr:hypothetical protein [Streptomyces paludis]
MRDQTGRHIAAVTEDPAAERGRGDGRQDERDVDAIAASSLRATVLSMFTADLDAA